MHFIFHSNKNMINFTFADNYHKKHFSVNKFCKNYNLCCFFHYFCTLIIIRCKKCRFELKNNKIKT